MSDTYPLRFPEAVAYLICIIVSTAMIWLLLISIFEPCTPCTEKTGEYLFLPAFILIIIYSSYRLFKMLFPARTEY
jgi:flagellar biosynthesis protein FliQ